MKFESQGQRVRMEFRWIQISFLLTALPQFTEAYTEKSLNAKYGEDVTLTCEHSNKPHNYCGDTTWNFISSGEEVELITEGNISEDVGAKKHRLRLTEDCSLVINNVQQEDAGRYECQQSISGIRNNPEAFYKLSVSAGEDTKKTTRAKTSAVPTATTETTSTPSTTRYSTTSQSDTNMTEQRNASNVKEWLWLYILVAAVAFILTVEVVDKVIGRKGNKTQMGDSPDDPEEGVLFVSISYTKNQSKAKGDGKAEDDHVTYATVKTSSAAVGASTDPSSLYSTVNKEKK